MNSVSLRRYFPVRSGNVSYSYTKPLGSSGQIGYYWSSAASSGSYNAWFLGFHGSGVDSSVDDDNRFYAYSLRCLAS